MKKLVALLLAIIMLFSFTACGEGSTDDSSSDDKASVNNGTSSDDTTEDEEDVDVNTPVIGFDDVDVSYVMIYNPKVYDEATRYDTSSLNSGSLSSYIDVDLNRGDGLEEPKLPFKPMSSTEINAGFDFSKVDIELNRGDTIITPYRKGDTREFYVCDYNMNGTREKKNFICSYAGKHCNIWTEDSSVSEDSILSCGQEFDNELYDHMIKKFGKSRFAENGGKVNFLFHEFLQGCLGYFAYADIYASGEYPEELIDRDGINLDHDIVSINSRYVKSGDTLNYAKATMTHEYQHLICQTSVMSSKNRTKMNTWFNEAMSGYIEESLYAGVQEAFGRITSFSKSNLIRYGQSLYNFKTEQSYFSNDIGVYGSVFLFSEYITNKNGEEFFKNVHTYWRDSYSSTLSQSEALYNSVSEEYRKSINKSIKYNDDITFASESDEWMSKMTLDFYVSMLAHDAGEPEFFKEIDSSLLLYDELNAADIEGGGRIIFATKDGKFEIPEDADKGLVYVGFNSNFEKVTSYIVK